MPNRRGWRSDLPVHAGGRRNGHIEQLPSGSWRAKVYAGTDALTGREIRFRNLDRALAPWHARGVLTFAPDTVLTGLSAVRAHLEKILAANPELDHWYNEPLEQREG